MNIKDLNRFRETLVRNRMSVSEMEYTGNNYDDNGKLIEEELPTITTDFCEIGLHDGGVYFVFVLDSKTFDLDLFDQIKDIPNIQMYGFVDFHKTLYPSRKFDFGNFVKLIRKDRYFQIQFNYKNINVPNLFEKYSDLVAIFRKSKAVIINQLEADLVGTAHN